MSVLVERDDRKVLLDAGASISSTRNGVLLGTTGIESMPSCSVTATTTTPAACGMS